MSLLDVLAEAQGKAIIWANYQYDIKRILKTLQDNSGYDSSSNLLRRNAR